VEKEANRFIVRWPDENIAVENGRWGPFIRFGKKMLKIDKKKDGEKYTTEEVANMPVEDIKKMIEAQVPGAFTKQVKAAAKKAATKKKAAAPKKAAAKKAAPKKKAAKKK
jgi:DNA topoisomerase-1